MKIFAEWCIKDEEKRIEASLRSVLPYVDYAVVVDSGSTDHTQEIVEKVRKDFPYLQPTTFVDIGPNKDMSIARNTALSLCPSDYYDGNSWYIHPAGDEVYDQSISKLRSCLENLPSNYIWVYTWFRHWALNEKTNELYEFLPGASYPVNGKLACGTPGAYRIINGMHWEGIWNNERLIYPGIGSYFRYTVPGPENKYVYFGADIWCDHYGWADEKRTWKNQEYQRLNNLIKQGKIIAPSW